MKQDDSRLATRILSAEDILAADDLTEEIVEIPEWGGAVKVRAFSKAVQQEFREDARIDGEIDSNRLEMLMFLHGVVEPRFTADQYELLRRKNAGCIDRVLRVITRVSGLDGGAVEAAQRKFPAGA
jgi:hypothetical protein